MKLGWLGVTSLFASGIAIVLVLLLVTQDLFSLNWFGIPLLAMAGLFSLYSSVSFFITKGSTIDASRRKLVIGLCAVALLCYGAGVGLSVQAHLRAKQYPSTGAPNPQHIQPS